MRLFLLFVLSALLSMQAFATDYSWTINGSGSYPSAIAACTSAGANSNATGIGVSFVNESYGYCYGTYTYNGTQLTWSGTWTSRLGDSCPSGSTFNSATGACDSSNKCAAAAGATAKSYHVVMTNSSANPPSTISVNGCEATFGGVMLCKNTTKGQYVCTGDATITGNELAANSNVTSEECTGDACTAGQPTDTKSDQDCVYAADGTGKATCTATASASHPGTTSCGTVNDVWTCIENPKSSSTDSTLYSEKTDVSNTDGTVTSTKDNTLTVVKCDGVNSCTTTTTSSTGTTTTKSDGTVVSNASTCSGSNCTSTGTTSTATDATDDGDDDASPTLTALKGGDKGSFDGAADEWDAKTTAAEADIKSMISQIKTAFSPIANVSFSSGGGKLFCPEPVEVLTTTISFCLDDYQTQLSWISQAFYVACAIVAAFIIFG